ncbi:MAG: sterol-binding protein [Proteobacteria bacterium]|nr:sterol-binding protein [Pseudomonadota bacterium]
MLADFPLFFINRLLAAEPWAAALLRPHVAQTALLEVAGLRLRFTVGEDLRLHAAAAESENTVSIRVPAEALGALRDAPENLSQHAHIEGNAAFAETLAKLLKHLRPDLAAWLAPYLGDAVATRTAHAVHTAGTHTLQAGQKLGSAVLSQIRDEAGLVVTHNEHAAFAQDLAELSAGIEALQQRLKALSGKPGEEASQT